MKHIILTGGGIAAGHVTPEYCSDSRFTGKSL